MAIKLISVIIPAFNEEKLLSLCLDSLKNQDYDGKYEIIVVDNASTDATARIASESGAKVVSCLRRGVAYARQAGAEAASGDIIVQGDADTLYHRDWLSRISHHFLSHPKSVALAGAYVYKDPVYWSKIEYVVRYLMNITGLSFLGRPVYISGANFAFRRDAFLKTNGYDPETLYPDQWGISSSLSRVGKIYYDGSLLVSTSTRRVQKPFYSIIFDIIRNSSRIMAFFIKEDTNFLRKMFSGLLKTKTSTRRTALILLAVITCLFIYGYVAPGAQVFGKVYFSGKTTDKVVALSFDDGPNEPYTSQIIDVLNKYGIKATFFVIGKNVELYPDVAKKLVANGDILGNHTYSHQANHALELSGDKDIEMAQDVIFKIAGVMPHLYRPPHGKKSPWELRYIKGQYLVEVTWADATNETHSHIIFGKPSAQEIANNIVSKARPGKIILLHDGYGTEHNDANSDKSLTVQVLPLVIDALTRQGYRFVTIPELLKIPAYNP